MTTDICKPRPLRKPKIYTAKTVDPRSHAFNVGIATDYSPDIALWLGHLAYWSEKNLANNKHIHDGLVWSYDTLDAICDYFPYYTRRQLETIINNSVAHGLVQCGNYNNTGYDRTGWYALTPKAYFYFQHLLTEKYLKRLFLTISQICEMDFTEYVNGFPRSVTTIPDTIPDTDPDKNSVGENPSLTQKSTKPNPKKLAEERAITSPEIKELFDSKFSGLDISIEELFASCQEHYEQKSLWASKHRFLKWVKNEKTDNYNKITNKQILDPSKPSIVDFQEYNAGVKGFEFVGEWIKKQNK